MKPEVSRCIMIACAAVLALGLGAASADAGAGNWVVSIRAYSNEWSGSHQNVIIGMRGSEDSLSLVPGDPEVLRAECVAEVADNQYMAVKLAASTPLPITWNLKIGQGSEAFGSMNINIYNLTTSLGEDQALDADLIYTFRNGATVLATFSTLANRTGGMVNWNDLSVLMKPAGWVNGSADRGWYYTDTTPTTSTTWAGLEDYSFTAEAGLTSREVATPEPSSLLALGSSLIGLAGLALRRRRA